MAMIDGFSHQVPDIDPGETDDWVASFDAAVRERGEARARYLLIRLLERARELGVGFPATVSTPYVNTIPAEHEPDFPGDEFMERRIRAFIRWNAAAMVIRANLANEGIGGHLATYASSASLYEVGFNHFFRGPEGDGYGDQIWYQGHAAPGIYARMFLEGRLHEKDLDRFRTELGGGLSSYPHPWLMPEVWQFPSVSMGLGPLAAIYQARFNRYLHNRGLADTSQSRVWCFLGDGETDEPESLGALSLAAREGLDNLIFVVNCNLQRLDGPVRGNGKIIQELEAVFRGAGWNVIKVIWGSRWDELLAKDSDGVLLAKMNSTVDGEFQRYTVEDGAYIREHFFGPDPRLRRMVEHLSDEELRMLPRGGHDYRKLYAAYKAATEQTGAPTAILAKTVKGWTLGPEIEARNVTHQVKKMGAEQLRVLRDRLHLWDEIPEDSLSDSLPPYSRPEARSELADYLRERREKLGGSIPKRSRGSSHLPAPKDDIFAPFDAGSGEQAASTTMVFVRLLRDLMRDEGVGERIVPIIPDEARTFGMESLFRSFRIYAPFGQRYEPVDAEQLLSYSESADGQIIQEGITEAGAMSTVQAAGTAYSTFDTPMIPMFIFYSMFGLQRTGDIVWAMADARTRGFLLGATAGRTTLNGEGLQHQDGHSHLLAAAYPTLRAYDPAFAFELATIMRGGLKTMTGPEAKEGLWYLTLYNETYPQPPRPQGVTDEQILAGMYLFSPAPEGPSRRATILFSGSAWAAASKARDRLAEQHDVAAEIWSVTSYKALHEDAATVERENRLHPSLPARVPYVSAALEGCEDVVAVSDFVRAVPDQIARHVPGRFTVLGTDGMGRSDTRGNLRRHFEVDADHVVVAVLDSLRRGGVATPEEVDAVIAAIGIDADAPDPRLA
ncbi:MAG: pyruvate dehydrogenase (acetyl-transferring), homodimeric type [Actinomycetota bacterium]